MGYFQRTVQMSLGSLGTAGGVFITMWWRFLRDMIDNGWRVKGSGDTYSFLNEGQTGATGTGYGGGYSVITSELGGEHNGGGGSDTRVVGGLGNIWGFPYTSGIAGASWIRLATPIDAEHYREYVFQSQWKTNQSSSRFVLVVYMTRDATAFAANGTEYEVPLPTDTSRYVAIAGWQNPKASGTGSSQSPNGVSFSPGSNGYTHWFIGDKESDYDFTWWSTRTSEQSIFRLFGQYRLQNLYADQIGDEDLDPYVIFNVGGTTEGSSVDVARGITYGFRPYETSPAEPVIRLESRVSSGSQVQEGQGIYATYGYWRSGDQPGAGTYTVCMANSYVENNVLPTTFGLANHDGRSIVQFNPVILRAGALSFISTPRFYKGRIKNDMIAISTRYDDPAVLEDSGPGGVGRRISAGFLHLRWIDGQPYLE